MTSKGPKNLYAISLMRCSQLGSALSHEPKVKSLALETYTQVFSIIFNEAHMILHVVPCHFFCCCMARCAHRSWKMF